MIVSNNSQDKFLKPYLMVSYLRRTKNIGFLNVVINNKQEYGKIIAGNRHICDSTVNNLMQLNCKTTLDTLMSNESVSGKLKVEVARKLKLISS